MLEKLLNWIDRFIIKHHKCKNYMELYSQTWETMGGLKACTEIEFRCSICGKSNKFGGHLAYLYSQQNVYNIAMKPQGE